MKTALRMIEFSFLTISGPAFFLSRFCFFVLSFCENQKWKGIQKEGGGG